MNINDAKVQIFDFCDKMRNEYKLVPAYLENDNTDDVIYGDERDNIFLGKPIGYVMGSNANMLGHIDDRNIGIPFICVGFPLDENNEIIEDTLILNIHYHKENRNKLEVTEDHYVVKDIREHFKGTYDIYVNHLVSPSALNDTAFVTWPEPTILTYGEYLLR